MQIEVSEDSLRSYGEQMISYVDEFENYATQFKQIVESISSIWDGEDAEKFTRVLRDEYIQKLNGENGLYARLTDYGNFLQNAGNAYDELDSVYASKSIDF